MARKPAHRVEENLSRFETSDLIGLQYSLVRNEDDPRDVYEHWRLSYAFEMRDASGKLILGANGQPVLRVVTTDLPRAAPGPLAPRAILETADDEAGLQSGLKPV